jgi:transposase
MSLKYCKLSPRQSGRLLTLFVAGSTARTAADLVGVHRNSAALFFSKLRAVIAAHQERAMADAFDGPVEIDESYFGGRRKGKRGRGAAGKTAVFGILRRGGTVFAQMIADCRQATLVPIIRRKVAPASVVYSDSWAGYDTLSVEGYEHERINHDEELVAAGDGRRHINGIENFWSQAKRHLRRFNGVPKESFPLFLQECVWRFNTGTPQEQLMALRKLLRSRSVS